jgi:serine kinase of HPr protein (carbohydrate metabolism regulator)
MSARAAPSPVLHATAVARRHGGVWRGVLLQGPSGSGKSDLALRAVAQGWKLVADDRTLVWRSGGRLYARGVERLSGLIEARHLGVLSAPSVAFCEAALVVTCEPVGQPLERIPEPDHCTLAGVELPRLRLQPLEPSALAKLQLALEAALRGGFDSDSIRRI